MLEPLAPRAEGLEAAGNVVPILLRLTRAFALATATVLAVAPALLPPRAWSVTGEHRWLGLSLMCVVAILLVSRHGITRPSRTAPDRGGRFTAGEVVLLVAMPVYVLALGTGRGHTSGDNAATRLLGPLIVRERTIDLSSLPEYRTRPLHYSATLVGDRVLPTYPLGTALLYVPYAAVALAAYGDEWRPRHVNRWERHLSALLAAAATAFLFLGVRALSGDSAALGTAFVFAFATTVFTSVSQALWSTTGEVFFLCLALSLVLPEEASALRCLLAGFAVGGAFLCRPTAVVAAVALGLVLLVRRRRDLAWYAAGALPTILGVVVVLYRLYGHPLGGYGLMHRTSWGHNVLEGLLGGLLSPSRGLLPFYPYLLVCPVAWRLEPTPALRRWLFGALATVGACYVMVSVFDHWTGGWSIGPRLMTEAAPFLAILTVPAWLQLSRGPRWRAVFLLAVAFAATTQVLAAYSERAERANFHLTDSAAFWSLQQSQLAAIWCLPCPSGGSSGPGDEDR
jgi:hypothetical protein